MSRLRRFFFGATSCVGTTSARPRETTKPVWRAAAQLDQHGVCAVRVTMHTFGASGASRPVSRLAFPLTRESVHA